MDDQTTEALTRNIIKIILYTTAILLNTGLLFVLWRDPLKRFRNSPSLMIANLALANIVAAIGGLTTTTTIFVCEGVCIGTHIFSGCLHAIGIQSSFAFMVLLAFDRLVAISHPYRYNTIFGSYIFNALLSTVGWATGVNFPPLIYYGVFDEQISVQRLLARVYCVDIIVLAAVTAVLYPLNCYNFRRRKRFMQASTNRGQAVEDIRLAHQLSITSMFAASVLLIGTCPYIAVLAFDFKDCPIKCFIEKRFTKFWANYQVARPIILFINPIIYAWRLPLYRKSSILVAKRLFHCISKRKQQQRMSLDSLSISNNNSSNGRYVNQLTCSTTGTNDVQV